jgi:hypothetical protein
MANPARVFSSNTTQLLMLPPRAAVCRSPTRTTRSRRRHGFPQGLPLSSAQRPRRAIHNACEVIGIVDQRRYANPQQWGKRYDPADRPEGNRQSLGIARVDKSRPQRASHSGAQIHYDSPESKSFKEKEVWVILTSSPSIFRGCNQ